MHGDHNFGQAPSLLGLRQFSGQCVHAHVVGTRINVHETDLSAAVARAVGAGNKGIRRGPQPIARAKVKRKASDVQRAGGAIHRDGMVSATVIGHRLFELRHPGALCEPI